MTGILVAVIKIVGYASFCVLGYHIWRNSVLIMQYCEGLIPQGCDAVARIPYQWIANAISCSILLIIFT